MNVQLETIQVLCHTQANTTASSALAAEMTNKADVLVAKKDGGMMVRTDACGCP